MTDGADDKHGNGKLLAAIAAGTLLVAAQVGAWLYFRARQPATDDRTRDRLRPRP